MGCVRSLFVPCLRKRPVPGLSGTGLLSAVLMPFKFLHALGFEMAGKGLWVVGVLQGDLFGHDAILYGLE